MLDKEIIDKIAGKEIADKLKAIEDIKVGVKKLQHELIEEKNKYEAKVKVIEQKIAAIRKTCNHEHCKHFPGCAYDAGYTQCLVCGAENEETEYRWS